MFINNKKMRAALAAFSVCLLMLAVYFFIYSSNEINKPTPASATASFPDYSEIDISDDVEYPAPVKQLQQVLAHSYVNEPTEEALELDIPLPELDFSTEQYTQPSELQALQAQLDTLKQRAAE